MPVFGAFVRAVRQQGRRALGWSGAPMEDVHPFGALVSELVLR